MPGIHALLCANGECDAKTLHQLSMHNYDLKVAVDGGLRHLESLGESADWLIGDFDSVDEQGRLKHEQRAAQVVRHPAEKDATDLELALRHVATLGVSRVTLGGIGGGRMDHTLANLLLLGVEQWPYVIRFYATEGTGYLITSQHPFHAELEVESELSLLPVSADVSGVSCSGLYYPLENAVIGLGSTLGISNVVKNSAVAVSVRSGSLLLLHNSSDIFAGT